MGCVTPSSGCHYVVAGNRGPTPDPQGWRRHARAPARDGSGQPGNGQPGSGSPGPRSTGEVATFQMMPGKGRVAVSPSGKLWYTPVKYLQNLPLSAWDLPGSI